MNNTAQSTCDPSEKKKKDTLPLAGNGTVLLAPLLLLLFFVVVLFLFFWLETGVAVPDVTQELLFLTWDRSCCSWWSFLEKFVWSWQCYPGAFVTAKLRSDGSAYRRDRRIIFLPTPSHAPRLLYWASAFVVLPPRGVQGCVWFEFTKEDITGLARVWEMLRNGMHD